MYAGIACGLLVFTGVWRATEWLMAGRNRDTWALVPTGLLYALLGGFMAATVGGSNTLIVALVVVAASAALLWVRRRQLQVRAWVRGFFLVTDVLIILFLLLSLIR